MAKKMKFYVVWVGVKPGIYTTWADTQLQIKGYPGARYKAFPNMAQAEQAWLHPDETTIKKSIPRKKSYSKKVQRIIPDSWSVDAACSGNPGVMEYRGVETDTSEELFRMGPFINGTNNIGEFLAIVHALALLKKAGDNKRVIYTDSRTAMAWVRNKKVKTTLKPTTRNEKLFVLINRAENWLKNNTWENQIIKWDTKSRGEIPADFGRK
jgi:ribonuclease HI